VLFIVYIATFWREDVKGLCKYARVRERYTSETYTLHTMNIARGSNRTFDQQSIFQYDKRSLLKIEQTINSQIRNQAFDQLVSACIYCNYCNQESSRTHSARRSSKLKIERVSLLV